MFNENRIIKIYCSFVSFMRFPFHILFRKFFNFNSVHKSPKTWELIHLHRLKHFSLKRKDNK